jgi:hypothetical protein
VARERFYIDTQGVDATALARGYAWLVDYAQSHGHSEAAIVVPQISTIPELAGGLGRNRADRLRKDRKLTEQGVAISIVTGGHPSFGRGPALAVWLTDDQLDSLDDSPRLPAICVLPWGKPEVTYWVEGRRPTEISTGAVGGSDRPRDVLTVAIESLRFGLNLMGDPYPLYEDDGKAAITALHGARVPVDPEEVRIVALRCNAKSRDAARLAAFAKRINTGHRLQVPAHKRLSPQAVERWRMRVEDPQA